MIMELMLGAAVVFSSTAEYDELGRVIAERGNNGQEYHYEYDQEGRRTASTDAQGRRTTMAYDARGRLVQMADPAGNTTRFAYDAGDRIVAVTDPRGKQTSYDYDGFGQLWKQVSPDTGTTAFAYDSVGQRTSMTRADGVVTQYSYDGLGRVTRIAAGEEAQAFAYDTCTSGKGQLCEASGPGTSTSFAYTPQGWLAERLDAVTIASASQQLKSRYAYDGLGRISSITYPSGLAVGYGYTDGRLTALSASKDGTVTHVVDAVQYVAMSEAAFRTDYGNGLLKEASYDPDLRLLGFVVKSGDTVVQQLDYGYSKSDEITRIADAVNAALTQAISYDPLGRLAELQRNGATHQMSYDANGNWTVYDEGSAVRTYAIDAESNRLLGYTSTKVGDASRQYGYDALGNRTSEQAEGDVRSYGYSPFNRLATATVNGVQTTYQLNALGQRLGKHAPASGNATRYTYLGQNQLLSEQGPDGAWTDYLWLGGELAGVVRGGQTYWVHNDHLGRPEVVTNASQAVVWKAYNYAYGRTVQQDGMGGLSLGFPGQYYDQETGLWYNGFRDYDPGIGRYLQSDPIGLEGGLNTYAYAFSSPLLFFDKLGLESVGSFNNGGHEMTWERGIQRWPDYFKVQFDLYVFGGSVSLSRSGKIFVGSGLARSYPNYNFRTPGFSLTAGFVNQACDATGQQVDDFLGGYGQALSAKFGPVGGAISWSPGQGTATEIGWGVGWGLSPGEIATERGVLGSGW